MFNKNNNEHRPSIIGELLKFAILWKVLRILFAIVLLFILIAFVFPAVTQKIFDTPNRMLNSNKTNTITNTYVVENNLQESNITNTLENTVENIVENTVIENSTLTNTFSNTTVEKQPSKKPSTTNKIDTSKNNDDNYSVTINIDEDSIKQFFKDFLK